MLYSGIIFIAITWVDIDPDLHRQRASLGHIELTSHDTNFVDNGGTIGCHKESTSDAIPDDKIRIIGYS